MLLKWWLRTEGQQERSAVRWNSFWAWVSGNGGLIYCLTQNDTSAPDCPRLHCRAHAAGDCHCSDKLTLQRWLKHDRLWVCDIHIKTCWSVTAHTLLGMYIYAYCSSQTLSSSHYDWNRSTLASLWIVKYHIALIKRGKSGLNVNQLHVTSNPSFKPVSIGPAERLNTPSEHKTDCQPATTS